MTATPRIAVIGGGITGLAATLRLLDRAGEYRRDVAVTLFEADLTLGGKVRTERRNGMIIEQGPDSMLARKPWGREFCARLDIEDHLVGSAAGASGVYVVHHRKLEPLPAGLSLGTPTRVGALFGTPLLSPAGKLRAALEPWVPRRRGNADETMADFFRRRLGREAAQHLAEPLLAGIYGGSAEELSILATFPHLRGLEAKYGSLTRGLRRPAAGPASGSGHPAPAAGKPKQTPPTAAGTGPGTGMFVTLRDGLAAMVDEAVRNLKGVRVLTGTRVKALTPGAGGLWSVMTAGGGTEGFDAVILAVPAPAAADLLSGPVPGAASLLAGIPYASTTVIALIYEPSALPRPLAGSGFLVPETEQLLVSGCTWVSAKWPHTSPGDRILIRCFAGGSRDQSPLTMDDDALAGTVHQELAGLMDLRAGPVASRVYRWPGAMPQYRVGHLDRVAGIEGALAEHPALAVVGAGLRGIGVPDCIHQGQEAADRLARRVLASQPAAKDVSPCQPIDS